jgi:hypothetical protein
MSCEYLYIRHMIYDLSRFKSLIGVFRCSPRPQAVVLGSPLGSLLFRSGPGAGGSNDSRKIDLEQKTPSFSHVMRDCLIIVPSSIMPPPPCLTERLEER